MTDTNDWNTAPKDGSEINFQFPDGTQARAKWNAQTDQWGRHAEENGQVCAMFMVDARQLSGGRNRVIDDTHQPEATW